MEEKIKLIVIALKNKDGDDILGYYLGESSKDAVEPSLILYRPIYIQQLIQNINGTPVTSYATTMYFRYGSQTVNIPHSDISSHDLASEFFSMFYSRSIGELMAREEILHESYIKFFENRDTKEVMKNTDSIFVDTKSEFTQ